MKQAYSTFPEVCRPILERIRATVKKPKRMPKLTDDDDPCLRWKYNHMFYCPMGRLKEAISPVPISFICFKINGLPKTITRSQIEKFANWWDSLTNAKDAVDFIWQKKRKKK